MSVLWLVFGLKGSPTGRGDRGVRNDAVTRLCDMCHDGGPCGLLSTEKPVMNSHQPKECLRAGFLEGSCSQFEESSNGMQKPPSTPDTQKHVYPPPDKERFIQGNRP